MSKKCGENAMEEGREFGPSLLAKHRLEPQTDLLSIVTVWSYSCLCTYEHLTNISGLRHVSVLYSLHFWTGEPIPGTFQVNFRPTFMSKIGRSISDNCRYLWCVTFLFFNKIFICVCSTAIFFTWPWPIIIWRTNKHKQQTMYNSDRCTHALTWQTILPTHKYITLS